MKYLIVVALMSSSVFAQAAFAQPIFAQAVFAQAAFAQAAGIGLEHALARAEARPPVVDARLAVEDAHRNASRTEADPLALRLDLLQAGQTAERAGRSLTQARFDAYAEIVRAYTQALEAQRQATLAALGRDLAVRNLEITEIRQERGSATRLDVQQAAIEAARSENSVISARQGLQLALDNLSSLVQIEDALPEPVPPQLLTLAAPAIADVQTALERHPTILQARHGVETARVARDLLDPSYASRAQIERAELQIERATEALAEARRGLELQATRLHDAVRTAAERAEVERVALADARDTEDLASQRLEAGLIAEIALDQARLSRAQAELAAMQADHDVLRALFDLQAGTVTPVAGIDAF